MSIDEELAQLVDKAFDSLKTLGLKVGVTESATGGLISKLFTDKAGISSVYYGSVTSYDNSVKHNVLGVTNDSLEKYGAVSPQVAEEMALGGKKLLGVDICLSDTGIAGPGGSEFKEEGLFYFGLAHKDFVTNQKHVFKGTRDENRKSAARVVLLWLNEYLEGLMHDQK